MKIGISTRDFLHLSGARDFLRHVILGIKSLEKNEVVLLVDIAFSLSEDAKTSKECLKSRINELSLRKSTKNKFSYSKSETNVKYAHSLRERLTLWLGYDCIEGLKIIPYSGDVKGIEKACKLHHIDVVIPTMFELSVPFVSYLYDCQHKRIPENFSASEVLSRDIFFSKMLEVSSSIIVNSLDVKNDLINFFNGRADAIFSLPFMAWVPADEEDRTEIILKKYNLPNKYFLVSNQFWIHKNLETVLFGLRNLIDFGVSDAYIVFTGEMNDSRFPDYVYGLMNTVKSLELIESTKFLGYIPKQDQLDIMKNCVAVLQPTLFEGGPGGGSIFDAEALGVRSIVSDIPVNLELPVSDRLTLFTAKDPESLACKMKNFWESEYIRPPHEFLKSLENIKIDSYSKSLESAILNAVNKSRFENTSSSDNTTNKVKISVVTVVKNADNVIRRTIDSVLNQSYENVEYIVIDGCSTDSTKFIVQSYGKNIRYICEPDDGIYDAMNKGINASTGDFLYFLNAGDTLYDQHVLKDVASVLNDSNYAGIDFFYGDVQFVTESGSKTRFLKYDPFPFYYYADNCQCHQVCFYRRALFLIYGNYDTTFKVYGDQEFNARIVVGNQVGHMHVNRTIANYVEGGYSEKMLGTGINQIEKKRIKERYFAATPDWFFDRLKNL